MRVILDSTIEVTCQHCRSPLAVSMGDITYHDVGHCAGTFDIRCCVCHRISIVPAFVIPQSWIEKLVPY